jgi:biotin carboxyl carrier protein
MLTNSRHPRWVASVLLLGLVALRSAEPAFSGAVSPEDFAAAGLGRLTPAELARLDALVRDYRSGALERARREAESVARASAAAQAAREAAEQRATQAEARARAAENAARQAEGGLLARAKVLLTPGTQVEYSTVESRLVGDFLGWEGRTLFTLENGQRWQSAGEAVYISPPIRSPAVRIVPGALGSFWLVVEGVKPRVKVVPVATR